MGPVWLSWTVCILLLAAGAASIAWFVRGDPPRGRRRCPKCRYDMTGVATLCCPECGQTARSERAQLARLRNRRWLALGVLLFATAAALRFVDPIIRRGWAGAPVAARIAAIPWCDLSDGNFQEPLNFGIGKGLSPWEQRLLARRLKVVFERNNDPSQRAVAASIAQHAWASGADMRSLRPELTALADDEDVRCARCATTAMTGIFSGDPALIPTWTRLLTESPHAAVRANAAGGLRAMDSLDGAAAEALRDALTDSDGMVVAQAAYAAGVQRISGAAPILLQLTRAHDASVRVAALRGLREMGPDAAEAVPALMVAFQVQDDPLRPLIAETLGGIGAPAETALPALLEACHDEKASVRGRAMIAVSRLSAPGDLRAVAAIVPALDADPVALQRAALEGLLRLHWVPSEGERKQVELIRLSGDPAIQIWARAVLLQDPSDLEPLMNFLLSTLRGPDHQASEVAADVLAALGRRAEPALPALDEFEPAQPGVFTSPDHWVRHQAAFQARRTIVRELEHP